MRTEAGAAGEADGPAPEPPAGPPPGGDAPPPDAVPEPPAPQPRRQGFAALSPAGQTAASLALAGIVVVTCVHLLMVFLHVAPSNTITKQYGKAVDQWVYPEFEQNWKLFAPNPLQQNIAVQARAEVRASGGEQRTTGWYDLSAADGAAIKGNLLPSHTTQNELRRAWDVYLGSHDAQNRSTSLRGTLSEQYLRRILVLRFDRLGVAGRGDVIERVQIRSRSVTIAPPKWSDEKVNQKPVYRQLPWWTVTSRDAPLDSGAHVRAKDRTDGAR
ncbi:MULTISPECIES: DUF5819 family protein [unclassified Streptomyces]|uniref:DUF5819 family protein n=1 Tax=unclassified Streptomyces TaxID=2593676 RepID=UPI000DB9B500|nr:MULTISPECIES: DUF5819 family protein [unclassified Streptomyces]MYT70134.1 hypothetical protein [Streptomyces sp. SID8367]RAJ88710.1 hypothetical protein K377_02166 [Streptomyces sp. PsTaAH-137]